MRRFLYALRLWAWFAARDEPKRKVPFSWFLEAYDRRQGIFRGEE
jgi:hypothetical protein